MRWWLSVQLLTLTMIAKMNARPLSGIVAVDIEDSGNARCNAFGWLLVDLVH